MVNIDNYRRIKEEAGRYHASITAVSKKKSVEDIIELIRAGQEVFGENYVQELVTKQKELPPAKWHFIGHLQSNKVRQIIPFITLIQSVDSIKLLNEIDRQAAAEGRVVDCLLEIHIASEETKSGFTVQEADGFLGNGSTGKYSNINFRGLMGMASNSEDNDLVRNEFRALRKLFDRYRSASFNELSMGMTSDYRIALDEGSTMIRIGSAIFGSRI
jgi:pyridoxal phosphate enzyme (YggS family)